LIGHDDGGGLLVSLSADALRLLLGALEVTRLLGRHDAKDEAVIFSASLEGPGDHRRDVVPPAAAKVELTTEVVSLDGRSLVGGGLDARLVRGFGHGLCLVGCEGGGRCWSWT